MFGYRDDISLSIANITNKNGEKLSIDFSLPKHKDIVLADDIVKASLYETLIQGNYKEINTYNIYIGEIQTIQNLQKSNKKYRITKKITDTSNISQSDPVCCFKEDNERYVVFAKVNEEDIIVKDIKELDEKIVDLTSDLILMKNSIQRVKQHIYKKRHF